MDQMKRSLIILNLAGELSKELKDYILSRNIRVVENDANLTEEDWTHILTKDVSDFGVVNISYDAVDKNRSIISLSKVEDLQNFTINNGNLILDNSWFLDNTGIGPFIMDKYFQGYGGLTLGDSYPAFKEDGSFKVVNPFNTGEYLDRMTHNAFEKGIDALTIKTFFDHFIMYLAGLKKKGKAGLPFEVMYGQFADIYAIQINFFSQDLHVLDIATSLSSKVTKKAEEYFLNTAVQCTDFFDFSYLPMVQKVSVTAFWTKDERVKFENRGLMLMSLINGASVSLITNKMEVEPDAEFSQVVKGQVLDDFTEKIEIPASLPEDPFKSIVSGENSVTDDEMQIIRGNHEKLDDVIERVKGKFEEDKSLFRVSGNKIDVEDVSFKIAASVNETTKENNLNIRSLENKLPEKIKSGIFDFAKNLNKDAVDLNDEEIVVFHSDVMPEILRQTIKEQVIDDQSEELQKLAIKTEDENILLKGGESLDKLVETIRGNFDEVKDTIIVPGEKLDIDKVSFVIAGTVDKSAADNNLQVRSLGQQLPAKVKTGLFDFAKGIDKDIDDFNSSDLTRFQTSKMPQIIQEEISSQIISAKSALEVEQRTEVDSSGEEIKHLKTQLKLSESTNEKLKSQLYLFESEMNQMKELKIKTSEIDAKVEAENKIVVTANKDPNDDKLISDLVTKLQSQSALTFDDMSKISALIESKSRLMESLKIEQNNTKKIQLSSIRKENFLSQEISRGEKQIKSKNLMLVKTKETFTRLLEKKESEITDLRNKAEQLAKLQANSSSLSQSKELLELEKKNQQLVKQVEVYQSKNAVLQQNLLVSKNTEDNKDELRKLQTMNQQIKSQYDLTRKQVDKLMEKHTSNIEQIAALKNEKNNLEQLLNKATSQKDRDKENAGPSPAVELEIKRLKSQNQFLEAQLKEATSKISHVESKLVEALRAQKAVTVQEDTPKMKPHIEASVKKLGQDLTESKNQLIELKKETNKLRQDKISLQNQLDKVKKDAEKAKPAASASPKKTGGKAA